MRSPLAAVCLPTLACVIAVILAGPSEAQENESAPEIEDSLRVEVRLRASIRERKSEEVRALERAARYGDHPVDAEQRLRTYEALAEQQRFRDQTRATKRIEGQIERAEPGVDRERLRSDLGSANRRSDFDARIDRLSRTLRRANGQTKAPRPSLRGRSARPRFSSGSSRLPAY